MWSPRPHSTTTLRQYCGTHKPVWDKRENTECERTISLTPPPIPPESLITLSFPPHTRYPASTPTSPPIPQHVNVLTSTSTRPSLIQDVPKLSYGPTRLQTAGQPKHLAIHPALRTQLSESPRTLQAIFPRELWRSSRVSCAPAPWSDIGTCKTDASAKAHEHASPETNSSANLGERLQGRCKAHSVDYGLLALAWHESLCIFARAVPTWAIGSMFTPRRLSREDCPRRRTLNYPPTSGCPRLGVCPAPPSICYSSPRTSPRAPTHRMRGSSSC